MKIFFDEIDHFHPNFEEFAPYRGQFGATQKVEDCFLSGAMWPRLSLPSRALLRSQGGPMTGLLFTCVPTAWHSRFDAQPFRVLLLRRLWLQLPSSVRNCRCGLPLDSRGHHCAACARGGPGPQRFCTGERGGTRLSRGWRLGVSQCSCPGHGSRPSNVLDNRKVEIVVNGLPLFMGAQLAVDTTIVFVLKRDGSVRSRCATIDGAIFGGSPSAQGSHVPPN